MGKVRGVDRQQNGRDLEDVAQAIHETLTRAHELVLEMVGESVTYTDKMQPGNGPGRRRNQVGYMREGDKGSTSGAHKSGGPGGTDSRPAPGKGPTPGKGKVAHTKGKTTSHIAKKPRGNSIAGRLAKAARLTHKLATYFGPPTATPAHAEEHQPYPVYEQRAPPLGVPDRDRWER